MSRIDEKELLNRSVSSALPLRSMTPFGVGASADLAKGTSLDDSASGTSPGNRRAYTNTSGFYASTPGAYTNIAAARTAFVSTSNASHVTSWGPRSDIATEIRSSRRDASTSREFTRTGTPVQRTPRALETPQAVASSIPVPSDEWRNFLKREFEFLETKLAAQLTKICEIAKTDRVREVAIQRIDQKLSAQEAVQTKLDRKVSEINGALKGLSDETQSHIQRIDGADTHLRELRQQMEEAFRQKCAELEEQQQAASSKCKVLLSACDETTRSLGHRVKRLETPWEESLGQPSEDVGRRLADLQARLEHVENLQRGKASAIALREESADWDADARHMDIQLQLNTLEKAFENLRLEAHGDDGWCAKLEEHEIRLGVFRQKMDSQGQFCQTLDENVRQDWEAKLNCLHKSIQDHGQRLLRNGERMDELDQWAKAADTAVEELYQVGFNGSSQAVDALRHRMDQAEDRILRLAEKLQELCDPDTMASSAIG